jgi:hypothetical protein
MESWGEGEVGVEKCGCEKKVGECAAENVEFLKGFSNTRIVLLDLLLSHTQFYIILTNTTSFYQDYSTSV